MATATPSREHQVARTEVEALGMSPTLFLERYGSILDAQAQAVVRFEMWPHLADLLDTFGSSRQVVILKSRQLGVSWVLAGYALWLALFRYGTNVLMVSQGQREASQLLDKVRWMHGQLPWRIPLAKNNQSVMEFPLTRSKISALPSTPDAGRGETATAVILDEFAFHEHGEQNLNAIKPTMDAGGQLIAVSTANGMGGAFATLWEGADGASVTKRDHGLWMTDHAGPNRFFPVFIDWSARPGRDQSWYEETKASAHPILFAQEYPADPSEAFVVSGRPVFNKDDLAAVFEPSPDPATILSARDCVIYRAPTLGRWYVLGADVAHGLLREGAGDLIQRSDASCAVVLDGETGEEVAHLHNRQQPDLFAADLHALATIYGRVRVGVERNGPGHQVLSKLRELQRSDTPYRLYYDTRPLKTPVGQMGGDTAETAMPGWNTDGSSKPLMIGELEAAVRNRFVTLHTRALYEECLAYQRLDDGETAGVGKHDDRVVALAIAWQMRKWPVVDLPTHATTQWAKEQHI